MFDIRFDPIRPLLHVRLHGFWQVDTVDAYGVALGEAIARGAATTGRFGLLIDAGDYPVQAAVVASRFADMVGQWPSPSPDGPLVAVALFVRSALGQIQARRTFGDTVAIFQEQTLATEWLETRLKES